MWNSKCCFPRPEGEWIPFWHFQAVISLALTVSLHQLCHLHSGQKYDVLHTMGYLFLTNIFSCGLHETLLFYPIPLFSFGLCSCLPCISLQTCGHRSKKQEHTNYFNLSGLGVIWRRRVSGIFLSNSTAVMVWILMHWRCGPRGWNYWEDEVGAESKQWCCWGLICLPVMVWMWNITLRLMNFEQLLPHRWPL